MCFPLSGVFVCIHLEFLKSGPYIYIYIIPSNYNYFLIHRRHPTNLPTRTWFRKDHRQSELDWTNHKVHDLEINNSLPLMDILLIRNKDKIEFKVFCDPTCKNNIIYFYSHYNTNSKRGIILGFNFRALHICLLKSLIMNLII